MPTSPPVALTIAGSDCSAGAGIQADLKAFSAHRVFGLTAVTCVVAEVPGKVGSISPVPPEVLGEQLQLLGSAFPIAAIKTGMLYSSEHVNVIIEWLQGLEQRPPIVIDPVMVATSGDPLLKDAAVDVYTEGLLPMAAVITPNLDEAAQLTGAQINSLDDLRRAAIDLAQNFATSVLAKGGHLQGETATDILANPDGTTREFEAPWVAGVNTHGTGCTYSAAIAAELAGGHDLGDAVASAKRFVSAAIRDYFRWQGTDALNHFQQP